MKKRFPLSRPRFPRFPGRKGRIAALPAAATDDNNGKRFFHDELSC